MKRPEMSVRERMLAVYQGQAVDKPALGIYQRYLPRGGKETQVRQNGMGLICYHPPVGTLYQESCLDAGGVGSEYISKHYITDIEDYKIMSYLVENTVFSPNKDYLSHSMEDLGDAGVMLARLDRSPYQKCLIELAEPEQFLVDLFTDPEEVEPLLKQMGDKMMEVCMRC